MRRHSSIHSLIIEADQTIELYSELEPGQKYFIAGTEYELLGISQDNYEFQSDTETRTLTTSELQDLIEAGDIKKSSGSSASFNETKPEYPNLDRFTRNTFQNSTAAIWNAANIAQQFSSTDFYTLDELITAHGINEMPLPGEGKYQDLIEDREWPLLKRYVLAISQDTDLPDEIG